MVEVQAQISLDGWQSIQIAYVIFILHQKIQKMAKCTFWYWLTRVVPDKVQRVIKCCSSVVIVLANTGFAISVIIQADSRNVCSMTAKPEADAA